VVDEEAPSCRRSISNGRFRPRLPLVRPAADPFGRGVRRGGAFGAQQYVLAAGPRAISSTFRHEPGLLGFLLVLNDVLVHPAALHLFVFRLEALWDCTLCSQRHVSEWWSGGRVLFAC